MNKVIYPFQIPIYETLIGDNDYNVIKKNVFSYIEKNISSFQEAWNCPTLSSINASPKYAFISNTFNKILQKCVEEYIKIWDFTIPSCKNFSLKIHESWINISPPGAYQDIHHHHKCLFSGVMYIDVTNDSGNLILKNPNPSTLILMPDSKINYNKYQFLPINQKLIMFPSWLEHYVSQNKTNKNRISISFNIIKK